MWLVLKSDAYLVENFSLIIFLLVKMFKQTLGLTKISAPLFNMKKKEIS
jgi:hypothetical protein